MIRSVLLAAAAAVALVGCSPAGARADAACVLGFTASFTPDSYPGLNPEDRAFMAENAKKPGVCITKSGVQYERVRALEPGVTRPRPTARDTVIVHYEGTLPDGTKFDSSYDRGQPIDFPLQGVIPGWTEGVSMMRPGEEFRLVIPPHMAYGEQGPPEIGPNRALVFKVELLAFQNAADGTVVAAPQFGAPGTGTETGTGTQTGAVKGN